MATAHSTMSGCSVVLQISPRKWSCLPGCTSIPPLHPWRQELGAGLLPVVSSDSPFLRKWILCWLPIGLSWLASCLLLSTTFARFLSTWWCRHLNQAILVRSCNLPECVGGRHWWACRGHRLALCLTTDGNYGGRAGCCRCPDEKV